MSCEKCEMIHTIFWMPQCYLCWEWCQKSPMLYNGGKSLPWKPISFRSDVSNILHTECHIGQYYTVFFQNFRNRFLYFIRDWKLGMALLHVKIKIWPIFRDVISLLAQVFIVLSDRVSQEVSMKKNWNFSLAQFLRYNGTVQNQCTLAVTLIFDLSRSNFRSISPLLAEL